MPPLSDQELLTACRAGDRSAWEALVGRYERLVYSVPLRLGLSRDDASDIFQLTFGYLLQSIDAIRDGARLGGWLATVARRQSWLFIQRAKREAPILDAHENLHLPADALVLGNPHPEGIERWELTQWLSAGLDALSARCRELLQLLYFNVDELPYTEVAARLDIPMGSIGPTRARCLQRLREALKPAQ